ncbi:MAG: cysteine hydrolase [Clostridia bacterium]|nr:cysteine hydrolase [Clostridia bacterium]
MENYLIAVDLQNDFVTGALGTPEAVSILPAVREKILSHRGPVIFTRDTHAPDYLSTQEGRLLPVLHCVKGTPGWEIVPELADLVQKKNALVFDKKTFGSTALASYLREREGEIGEVELIGLCTDICVVSNALTIKAFLPETPVSVDARCCAGVTPEKHAAALETMKSCQIAVKE